MWWFGGSGPLKYPAHATAAKASTPAPHTIANTFFISTTSFLGRSRCRDRDVGQLVERLARSSLPALTRRRQRALDRARLARAGRSSAAAGRFPGGPR